MVGRVELFDPRGDAKMHVIAFWNGRMPKSARRIPKHTLAGIDHQPRMRTISGLDVFHRGQRQPFGAGVDIADAVHIRL